MRKPVLTIAFSLFACRKWLRAKRTDPETVLDYDTAP
jgi:hypothetical protein